MNFLNTTLLITLLLIASACTSGGGSNPPEESIQGEKVEIEIESLANNLNHPWGMAFLPDSRLLVTERNTGNLYILGADKKLSQPLSGVPTVHARGQGGLMDVALDPNFKDNQFIYLSYAKSVQGGMSTAALGRGKLNGNSIENFKEIFEQTPYINDNKHYGNRIAFSPDGQFLYFAMGERFQFEPAQDLSTHLGKVIRIFPDGRVPNDNPYVGVGNAKNEIWSSGHRNVEAMAFDPQSKNLWLVEMGPKGGDELNMVEKGKNYGWPEVSWGEHYDGSPIPNPPTAPRFEDAKVHWTPVISPSGMTFYQGEMFPSWKGSALVGGLSSQALVRISVKGNEAEEAERFDMNARIRDVEEAPDGSVYVLTDQADGGIWRITPKK